MKIIIPEGTRDYTNEECIKRNEITKILLRLFYCWGYELVETPTIEYYSTFNYCEQSLTEGEIYKFFDNNGRILVLRPDMTIPVARMVCTKLKDMELPIKLCYSANIFRVNESLLGRQNEFLDCGVELIGVNNNSDLEVLVTALESIKALGFDNFKLEIGNINILKGALDEMNLGEEERQIVAELIDKKSLTSLENYLSTMTIESNHREFLTKLPWLFGEREVIEKGKELSFNNYISKSIAYLEWLYNALCTLGYEEYIAIDMAMVPRLNYYTGIIFRGYVQGIGADILAGGRYDNLLQNFGRDLSAVGFSLKIDLVINSYKNRYKKELMESTIEESDGITAIQKALYSINNGKRVKIIYEKESR